MNFRSLLNNPWPKQRTAIINTVSKDSFAPTVNLCVLSYSFTASIFNLSGVSLIDSRWDAFLIQLQRLPHTDLLYFHPLWALHKQQNTNTHTYYACKLALVCQTGTNSSWGCGNLIFHNLEEAVILAEEEEEIPINISGPNLRISQILFAFLFI